MTVPHLDSGEAMQKADRSAPVVDLSANETKSIKKGLTPRARPIGPQRQPLADDEVKT